MPDRSALETAKSVWAPIEAHLEAERRRILQAIQNYPTPIAGCDQQFNHLLAERDAIGAELARLRAAIDENLEHADPAAVIEAFIASSSHFDVDVLDEIRTAAGQVSRKP